MPAFLGIFERLSKMLNRPAAIMDDPVDGPVFLINRVPFSQGFNKGNMQVTPIAIHRAVINCVFAL
jgi:hypothetical protein